jgi:hypothetical protein
MSCKRKAVVVSITLLGLPSCNIKPQSLSVMHPSKGASNESLNIAICTQIGMNGTATADSTPGLRGFAFVVSSEVVTALLLQYGYCSSRVRLPAARRHRHVNHHGISCSLQQKRPLQCSRQQPTARPPPHSNRIPILDPKGIPLACTAAAPSSISVFVDRSHCLVAFISLRCLRSQPCSCNERV